MRRPGSGNEPHRTRKLLWYAAAFVILAYAPFLAPAAAVTLPGLMIFWSFFCSTTIILCDEATQLLEGRSLIAEVTAGGREFVEFVASAAISGLLLDGVGQWIGKLWIYPYWTRALYASTFVLGFCAYWLLLAEIFLVGRSLLARAAGSFGRRVPRWGPLALRTGAFGGGLLMLSGLSLAAQGYRAAGGYRFEISLPSRPPVPFACFPLIFTGVWLILEFIHHRLGRDSLLGRLIRGDWLSLLSMAAVAWSFGLFMETVNTANHFWRYTNWPLGAHQVFGVPLLVLLLWPLQYVVFLSVYHAVSGRDLLES